MALVVVAPIVLDGLPLAGRVLAQIMLWVLLLAILTVVLAVVYRFVVGVVSQETYLLHTSVRENLRAAKPDATDAEIEAAARAARSTT